MLTIVCGQLVIGGEYYSHHTMHKKKSKILVKFGQRVRLERTKRRLSQEQLAELAGVHRTYIGMIERAEKNITLENISRLAIAMDLKIQSLFKHIEARFSRPQFYRRV